MNPPDLIPIDLEADKVVPGKTYLCKVNGKYRCGNFVIEDGKKAFYSSDENNDPTPFWFNHPFDQWEGIWLLVDNSKAEYDPKFGDDRVCDCGHAYYRHFDTYEDMSPVGCKYCSCKHWVEPGTGTTTCGACNSDVTVRTEKEKIPYGPYLELGILRGEIEVEVPVYKCVDPSCGLEFTDYKADKIRDAAMTAEMERLRKT